jgi:prepilin-type N-terminal cleavage/methylation domain-containing protein
MKKTSGFTLIELLLTIAVVTALAVAVFVALNPTQRLKDARDARRTADVESILVAVSQYVMDNKGALPAGVTTTEVQLGTSATGCTISTGGCSVSSSTCLDLSTALAKYLKSMPYDPKIGSATGTAYSISADANNLITVKACGTEGTVNISASR